MTSIRSYSMSQSSLASVTSTTTKSIFRAVPTRFIVAILGSGAMFVIFMMMVNLNVAVIRMVNHTALMTWVLNETQIRQRDRFMNEYYHPWKPPPKRKKMCPMEPNDNISFVFDDGTIAWDPMFDGLMECSYYWSYFAFQILGGILADHYSMKWAMFAGLLLNVVGAVLVPVLARFHIMGVIGARLIQGVGGAISIPCTHVLLARWAPKTERLFIGNIVYSGVSLGIVVGFALSAFILKHMWWQWVYYIEAAISVPFLILWCVFVTDNPAKHKFIGSKEKRYLVLSLREELHYHNQYTIPWQNMFRSTPFWAIFVAHMCHNWGWYLLLLEMPFFFFSMLHYDVEWSGIMCAVPFIFMWFVSLITGKACEKLESKKHVHRNTLRKWNTLISCIVPIVCFLLITFFICSDGVVFTLIAVLIAAQGTSFGGFFVNHIDIGPRFAGLLVAITNTAATIPAMFIPLLSGRMLRMTHPVNAWRMMLGITAVFYAIEALVYIIFAKTGIQTWNVPPDSQSRSRRGPTVSITAPPTPSQGSIGSNVS